MNKVLVPEPDDAILTKSPDKKIKINELCLNTIDNPKKEREMPDSSE